MPLPILARCIDEVRDHVRHQTYILGDPASGKTTTALQLSDSITHTDDLLALYRSSGIDAVYARTGETRVVEGTLCHRLLLESGARPATIILVRRPRAAMRLSYIERGSDIGLMMRLRRDRIAMWAQIYEQHQLLPDYDPQIIELHLP